MEGSQPSSLSQSMVFSNSKQGVPLSQTSSSTPYTQHSMVRWAPAQSGFYMQPLVRISLVFLTFTQDVNGVDSN